MLSAQKCKCLFYLLDCVVHEKEEKVSTRWFATCTSRTPLERIRTLFKSHASGTLRFLVGNLKAKLTVLSDFHFHFIENVPYPTKWRGKTGCSADCYRWPYCGSRTLLYWKWKQILLFLIETFRKEINYFSIGDFSKYLFKVTISVRRNFSPLNYLLVLHHTKVPYVMVCTKQFWWFILTC